MNPMNNKERKRYVHQHVRPILAGFTLRGTPPTKSWFMRGKTWNHSFTVVWTPGRLAVSGDIGDCAYDGCTFFRHWAEAAEAVIGCDFHYLTGKTGIREVYDREETLRDIVQMANEEAIRFRKEERKDRARHREMLRQANVAGGDEADDWGEAWGPFWEPFSDNYPEYRTAITERRDRWPGDVEWWKRDKNKFEVPDGWHMWHRIERELDGYNLDSIFTIAGRRSLKDEMPGHLETHDQAAEFCGRIGFDDYYGTTNLPSDASWYFEAIQAWARLVCQTEEFDSAIVERRALMAREDAERRRQAVRWRRIQAYEDHTELAIADDDGMGQMWGAAA